MTSRDTWLLLIFSIILLPFSLVFSSPVESDELKCLAEVIYHEARGEPKEGQIGVGLVVLNRVQSNLFPDTTCEVVYQSNQFSWVRYHPPINNKKVYSEIRELASSIASSYWWYLKKYAKFKGILFFDYYNSNLEYAFTVGKHKFYRLK